VDPRQKAGAAIAAAAFNPSDTIVLLSEGGAHAAQAWVFLQIRGYRNVFFLRGGTAGGRRYEPGRDGC
jgi:3-mercaptopyruvate sulfurtransferase SseA